MRAKYFCIYVFIIYINDLWLFLMVPWFGLQCVFVVFPALTSYLFYGTVGWSAVCDCDISWSYSITI